MKRLAAALGLCVSAATAQMPRVTNAQIEKRAGRQLDAVLRSIVSARTEPEWVAYTVPAEHGRGESCCWTDGGRACGLEGRVTGGTGSAGPVLLEGSPTLVVLLRIENHAIVKVRSVSGDCELDAGGLPLVELDAVNPRESVQFLRSQVTAKRDQALAVMASHADPSAVEALLSLAKSDPEPHIRGQALFWLAQRAGKKETAAITDAIANDPVTGVKKKAVFALQQLPKDEGVPLLIQVAKTNPNPALRKQAMFWLGQSQDARALAFFQEVLTK